MVKQISDIKYILVENEVEALILETNLIKEYQPKYNILMKD
jgi:excinuclease ABC subunit C